MKILETKILLPLMFLLLAAEIVSSDNNDVVVEVHQIQNADGCGYDGGSGCGSHGCCDCVKEVTKLVKTLAASLQETKESVNEIKEIVKELSARNCTEGCVVCPFPFTKVGEECFYRGKMNDNKNWDDARAYCIQLGGDLATPENVPLLRQYLEEIGMPGGVWIGANDRATPDDWKYLNGQEIKQSDWGTNNGYLQPDNSGGREECLEINTYVIPPLNDNRCQLAEGFVCQYGAPGCLPGVGC